MKESLLWRRCHKQILVQHKTTLCFNKALLVVKTSHVICNNKHFILAQISYAMIGCKKKQDLF